MRSRPILSPPRALALSLTTLVALVVAVSPAGAGSRSEAPAEQTHCVASVVEQTPDGELILDEPACFETAEEADSVETAPLSARASTVTLALVAADDDAATSADTATITLGTHYDGNNGTGASIAIKGSGCSGGYWNATGTWKNRINSSKHGCYRLVHYDYQNKSGAKYTTYGTGKLNNLGTFVNRTESVSYHRS